MSEGESSLAIDDSQGEFFIAVQRDQQYALRRSLALCAGIDYNLCMQYTVRGISPALDKAIRRRAREKGKSLNQVALEALADGLGFSEEEVVRRDLSGIVGTWKAEAAVESALAAQDEVDEALWK